MKTLILMRHAQAGFSTETDGQRALTPTGKEQALQTGLSLKKAGFTPQVILCSPLLRARQSAQLAGSVWDLSPLDAPELDGRLSAAGLLEFASEQLQKYDHVMLVGHNPNVSIAAATLSGRFISFRPADVAGFDFTNPKNPKKIFEEIS